MPHPVIQRIDSLKELPLFNDYSAPANLPTLQKHNLIYGFNGCGKTTISRVLASLGSGALHSKLPVNGTFNIILTDGDHLLTDSIDKQLKQRIFVFNEDFKDDNFRWKEGTANGIIYIGHEQKELSTEIENKTIQVEKVTRTLHNVLALKKQIEKLFVQHKRDAARLIADVLVLGRNYNSKRLETDYTIYKHSDKHKQSNENYEQQKRIIMQNEPLSKLKLIPVQLLKVHELVKSTHSILITTLGTLSLEVLQDHDTMLQWVKQGLNYHQMQKLDLCLLCGNELSKKRIQLLEGAIDDSFDNLTNDISDSITAATALQNNLDVLKTSIQIGRAHV